jgi:hypothetical protein
VDEILGQTKVERFEVEKPQGLKTKVEEGKANQ